MGFLIDTCIWVDIERGKLAPADVALKTGEEPVFISPVTLAELTYGAYQAKEGIRAKRLAAIKKLRNKPVLKIDEITGEIFGRLASELTFSGRGHKFRIQDLWLASQAIQHAYFLLTHNVKDFADIPGLQLKTL